MAKYIDREKALAFPFANGNYNSKNADSIFIRGCEAYKEYLESLPAADVAPVVRGEWVDMGDFEQCSVCTGTHLKEFTSYYGKVTWVRSNFCPNCGADMREVDNG